MEEDIDIYADLTDSPVKTQEKCTKCSEFEIRIDELNKNIEKFQKVNKNLKINISSLLKTAKAEVSRKDKMIADLRRQLDDITFRRGTFQNHENSINNPTINAKFTKKGLNVDKPLSFPAYFDTSVPPPSIPENSTVPCVNDDNMTEYFCKSEHCVEEDDEPEEKYNPTKFIDTVYTTRLRKKLKEDEEREARKKLEEEADNEIKECKKEPLIDESNEISKQSRAEIVNEVFTSSKINITRDIDSKIGKNSLKRKHDENDDDVDDNTAIPNKSWKLVTIEKPWEGSNKYRDNRPGESHRELVKFESEPKYLDEKNYDHKNRRDSTNNVNQKSSQCKDRNITVEEWESKWRRGEKRREDREDPKRSRARSRSRNRVDRDHEVRNERTRNHEEYERNRYKGRCEKEVLDSKYSYPRERKYQEIEQCHRVSSDRMTRKFRSSSLERNNRHSSYWKDKREKYDMNKRRESTTRNEKSSGRRSCELNEREERQHHRDKYSRRQRELLLTHNLSRRSKSSSNYDKDRRGETLAVSHSNHDERRSKSRDKDYESRTENNNISISERTREDLRDYLIFKKSENRISREKKRVEKNIVSEGMKDYEDESCSKCIPEENCQVKSDLNKVSSGLDLEESQKLSNHVEIEEGELANSCLELQQADTILPILQVEEDRGITAMMFPEISSTCKEPLENIVKDIRNDEETPSKCSSGDVNDGINLVNSINLIDSKQEERGVVDGEIIEKEDIVSSVKDKEQVSNPTCESESEIKLPISEKEVKSFSIRQDSELKSENVDTVVTDNHDSNDLLKQVECLIESASKVLDENIKEKEINMRRKEMELTSEESEHKECRSILSPIREHVLQAKSKDSCPMEEKEEYMKKKMTEEVKEEYLNLRVEDKKLEQSKSGGDQEGEITIKLKEVKEEKCISESPSLSKETIVSEENKKEDIPEKIVNNCSRNEEREKSGSKEDTSTDNLKATNRDDIYVSSPAKRDDFAIPNLIKEDDSGVSEPTKRRRKLIQSTKLKDKVVKSKDTKKNVQCNTKKHGIVSEKSSKVKKHEGKIVIVVKRKKRIPVLSDCNASNTIITNDNVIMNIKSKKCEDKDLLS